MIFESKDNTYEVIRLLAEYEAYDTYLCLCDDRRYILLRLRDEELQRSCGRLFLGAAEQNNFDGLREIFSNEDEFMFVFNYSPLEITLNQMFEDYDLTFSKRLELLQKILAGLCVHEIPVFVACDLFLHGNIGIDADDTGNGYYTLMEPENYESFDINYFGSVLADCVRRLFPREIKKNQYRELAEFTRYLEAPESFLEIYEVYTNMSRTLTEKLNKKGKQDGKASEISIEKAKKLVNLVKSILIFAILLAALGVLIWSFKGEKSDGGGIYAYIGDVTIQEYTGDSTR